MVFYASSVIHDLAFDLEKVMLNDFFCRWHQISPCTGPVARLIDTKQVTTRLYAKSETIYLANSF